MKNSTRLFILPIVLVLGLFGFTKAYEPNSNFKPLNAESTLQKTIDFEDLTSGNMSATALNNSFYGGIIVADGKISKTATARIDDNTLGMRMPGNSTSDPRIAVIQVGGYSKIVLDLKQERTYTKIATGCSQIFFSSKNGDIIRDIEIPTYGYHEITLTFYAETSTTSTADCGIDNIRFYGSGTGESSQTPPSSEILSSSEGSSISRESSSSEEITRDDTPPIVGDTITMRGIADFLETKEAHYPLSDEFIETYQQTSGGYIDLAKKLGLLVDKSKHEPNQKWHFFDSWMYPSILEGTLTWASSAKDRVYTRLLCPELLLWIYEACEVPTDKIEAAMTVAIEAKIAGTNISTMAKNMRACVPWVDLELTIKDFISANY